MPFYPSTIYPSSPSPIPPSPGLSPTRLRLPPRSTSLTPRALARFRNRPPNIKLLPEPDSAVPLAPDAHPAVPAVDAWRRDDAVELWRRRVAAEEQRRTLLVVIGEEGDAAEAVDELRRLMEEGVLVEEFTLADLQLPLEGDRAATPSRHLSDVPTPTTDTHRLSEIMRNPILVPPSFTDGLPSDPASHAAMRAHATSAALAAERRQHDLARRLRLSEQRFAFPPRQVGSSLAPGAGAARGGFHLGLGRRPPSEHTLEITMENAGKSVWGLRKKSHVRAATLQVDTAAAATTPVAVRTRSATLQVPAPRSPALTTSQLSETYSLTPIDLYATPSKAAALQGLFPAVPTNPAGPAAAPHLAQPRPPFARPRVDSTTSTGSSAASYWSNCFPPRPSMSSSRTKTSGTLPAAGGVHGRQDSLAVQHLGLLPVSGGARVGGEVLGSPLPFQGLLPCFRESVSLPDLHAQHMRELLSSPTPDGPCRPPRNPNRPTSKPLPLSSPSASAPRPPAHRLRKLAPSPLSGLARKLSLTRTKRTSTTDLKRKQSAKRGLLGMPLRSASQTDLLEGEAEAESPVAGRWPAPAAWEVEEAGRGGFEFPMPPGLGSSKAERRRTRQVWEAESERLRLRLSGVGGSVES